MAIIQLIDEFKRLWPNRNQSAKVELNRELYDCIKRLADEVYALISDLGWTTSNLKIEDKAGISQGNWNFTPWIPFYAKNITDSTMRGIYPIIFIAPGDSSFRLSLNYGDAELTKVAKDHHVRMTKERKGNISGLARQKLYNGLNLASKPWVADWDTTPPEEHSTDIIAFTISQTDTNAEDEVRKQLKQLLQLYWEISQKPDDWKALWEKVKAEATGAIIAEAPAAQPITPAVTSNIPDHEALITELQELLIAKKQIVLTGAPGTGKTYLAKELAAKMLGCTREQLADITVPHEQYEFRQFHPGYDYSDFVEGLKPVVSDDGSAYFKRMDGTFMAFCKKAEKAIKDDLDLAAIADNDAEAQQIIDDACKNSPYVMVIDEINRADLSRVFGELFYGLEKDYRGETIPTQYDYLSSEAFSIPPNVYIIGTMNDIDRSVESMDFALRRRFAWQEISIRDSECILARISDAQLRDRTVEVMHKVNKDVVEGLLGLETAYYLGAAYFRDIEKYTYFLDEDSDDCAEWEMLWKHNLSVILTEYLRTSRRRIGLEVLHDKYMEICKEMGKKSYSSSNTASLDDCAWIISPGQDAAQWDFFKDNSIIAIDFDAGLGDLTSFASIESLKQRLLELDPGHYGKKRALDFAAFMLWSFTHSLHPGTVVYARKGTKQGNVVILGRGEITGAYVYNATRQNFRHELKVNWTWTGESHYSDWLARQTLAPVEPGEKMDKLEKACQSIEE